MIDNSITFIIPTIGRKTLKNTLISLQNQTIENWKAILIFDDCDININNIEVFDLDTKNKFTECTTVAVFICKRI